MNQLAFLDLRPVEEFRHTPIIPISEKDLADHRKKVEEANRKGYYVEIKKDTIYFYCKNHFIFISSLVIASLSLGIIIYVFMMANEKQMQIKKNLDRTKMLRHKANSGKSGGNKKIDRDIEDIEHGRKLF
jgi:hypothetical protein